MGPIVLRLYPLISTAVLTTASPRLPQDAPVQWNRRVVTAGPTYAGTTIAFLVVVVGRDVNAVRGCGGCVVLHQLADTLIALGQRVRKIQMNSVKTRKVLEAKCDAMADEILTEGGSTKGSTTNTTTKIVVVYPELYWIRCRRDPAKYVHILWVLAPMGSGNKNSVSSGSLESVWAYNDLVFTYGTFNPGTAVPVTHANLLQAPLNPTPTDEFRASVYPPLPRKGTAFLMRKGHIFHPTGIKPIHKPGDTELSGGDMAYYIQAFRTHKYVVCYDPYTFYAWIAAQLGCIPIIYPIVNTTKREWLLQSGYLGGYMEYSGAQDAYGIAYGWDEVEYARRTIHLVREQLWAAKSFAHSVTVPRFIRDAQRAARGERDFEGAMWSHDLYPRGWYANLAPKFKNQLGG